MFINHELITELLKNAKKASKEDINNVLEKAQKREKLSYEDIAVLLEINDKNQLDKLFKIAGEIKNEIYGNRVVLFAPLYISNYCVNDCVYCGYQRCNKFERKKLSQNEIKEEVKILENLKRIMKEKTSIIISHRISAVKDADIIIYNGHPFDLRNTVKFVMINGEIVKNNL